MSVKKKDTWPTHIKRKASQNMVKKIEETHQDNNRSKEIEDADADEDEDEDREEDPLEFEQHTRSTTKPKVLKKRPKTHEPRFENLYSIIMTTQTQTNTKPSSRIGNNRVFRRGGR